MAQKKILVDSNSYFRLAQNIRPLLFEEFGEQKYCLYVLQELDLEYQKSPRLKSKFPWVNEPEYANNRKHYPTVSKQQATQIENAFDYIWAYVQDEVKGPSRTDVLYLAHAYVLGIAVVTDDVDMIATANEFGISIKTTLEILHLMRANNHITDEKIDSIVAYWKYVGDEPANFAKDFRRLFGRKPPS